MKADKFLVGGEWVDPHGSEVVQSINPSTEEAIGEAVLGDAQDADRAVSAAKQAFTTWQTSSIEERIAVIRRMRAAYEAIAPEMERHLTREIGLTPMTAQGQTRMTLSHFDVVLGLLPTYEFAQRRGETITLRREPVGVVVAITSWNAPVNQMLCKAIPAIAAGCTVIVKPSELAPLCGHMVAEAMAQANVPQGVFNLLNGRGGDCGRRLVEHPDVAMVSVTGSVAGGGAIAQAAAPTIKRVHQELGGKSPNILMPDADFPAAVKMGVMLCMMAAGQVCAAPTRMIVPEDRFEEVAELAIAAAEGLKVGPPDVEGTNFGPLSNRAQFERVNGIIADAISSGESLLTGGPGRPEGLERGWFAHPTIFGPVAPDARIAREEIFGPVLCILTYRDLDHAVEVANATDYGLAAWIAGTDVEQARRLGARIRAGYVNINYPPWTPDAPFGGYGRSGNGRQYGVWGFEEFLELKAVVG